MKLRSTAAGFIAASFAAMQFTVTVTAGPLEQKITTFLWSAPKSTEEKTELIYHDVKDNYNTRIAFTREKQFRRSDGIHGSWHFEGGKLVLTGLDAKDGFTIIFDPPTSGESQLTGRIPKGKWKAHKVLLKLPK